ncbi:amidohydrolase [Thermophagus sp. OGC60D27]|uniref:amidohydrolase n=1 Tax=Thermophagus sp. OGC60D27 TaxID=3458415 RepID=UPI004037E2DC
MKIALIETSLYWCDIDRNLKHFQNLIESVAPDCKMVLLPEMFSTGFTMQPEQLQDNNLQKVPLWFKEMAIKQSMAIGGSSVAHIHNNYYNRFYFAIPGGELHHYDKRHLFRMGEEQHHYTAGNERKVFDFENWRISPQICYDLRFPVWSRNRNDFDMLIYVANWPASRQDVWTTLLKARAIENQCYVAGVNRTGTDPQVGYAGGSVVYSPKGESVSYAADINPSIIYADINLEELNRFRQKFPAWKDADDFEFL